MHFPKLSTAVLAAVVGLLNTGCQRDAGPLRSLGPLSQDEPLVLQFDEKNRVLAGGRWMSSFSDASFDAYVKAQAQRYRDFYVRTGTPLPYVSSRGPQGPECREALPTQIILLVDPKTSTGSIRAVTRRLRDAGFASLPQIAVVQTSGSGPPTLAPYGQPVPHDRANGQPVLGYDPALAAGR